MATSLEVLNLYSGQDNLAKTRLRRSDYTTYPSFSASSVDPFVLECSLPACAGLEPAGSSPLVVALLLLSASCHDGIDGLPLLDPTPKRGGTEVGMDDVGGELDPEPPDEAWFVLLTGEP